MLQEKQFYLMCLEEGPKSQRTIARRMSGRFGTSPAAVKDALLRDGLIEVDFVKREGSAKKLNYYFKLTNKRFDAEAHGGAKKQHDKWEDGTPKSKGNAFDLSTPKKSMFDKGEIARMTQKYHQNKPITVYSRA